MLIVRRRRDAISRSALPQRAPIHIKNSSLLSNASKGLAWASRIQAEDCEKCKSTLPLSKMHALETMNGIIFTLLLVTLAATSPIFSPSVNHVSSEYSIHSNHIFPEAYSSFSDMPTSRNPENNLLKRAPNGGPIQTTHIYGWDIRYRQYLSFIIPVQVAASVLEEFYTACLRRIALKQSLNIPAPGNALTLTLGSVFLAFRAADPSQALTWVACEVIVDSLLSNARMGLTNQFKSEWFHPETGKLVYVSLSMLQQIGPGRVGGNH